MLRTGYLALQGAAPHDNTIMGLPAALVTLVMIVVAVVILVLVVRAIASVYQKVPPEKALVIYGAGATRVISGGSSFVWPFINQSYEMNLTINQVEIELDKVPNKDKVPVNVKAVATYKISNKDDLLMKAAQNFGSAEQSADRGEDTKEVKVKHILESHLRSVISQLDLEDLLSKRDTFNQRIQNDSEPELEELGLELKSFNILHVSDDNGVIDALGRKETAKILADAEIEQASQNRRKTIETTTAQKEAETTAAQNQTLIASAQRDRDKQTLGFEADVAKQKATTEQAGPLSQAEAKKVVVKAEVEVKQNQAEAEIALQDAVRKRNEAEYRATIITKAEAERQQKVIEAEGAAKARTTMAAAEKEALEAEGDGQAKKIRATGLANADVAKETGLASAEAEKAALLAKAEGRKAELLAEAEGTRVQLDAQAEGRQKLVAAYANMDPEQRKLFLTTVVLDRLPETIAALGDAGQKIMQPIAEAVTAALAQIDSVTVFDSGSGSANGNSALGRVLDVGPQTMFNVVQQLKALGLLPVVQGLAAKLGLDLGQFQAAENNSHAVVITQPDHDGTAGPAS